MALWGLDYYATLLERFEAITDGLDDRISDIREGRSAPKLDDMTIGSGRKVMAAVVFFDICDFTKRTSRDDLGALAETLYMLDCVVPMVMHVVYDYGGYVEKNTGDGVMAIIGVGEDAAKAATDAMEVAVVSIYAIDHIVNPHLMSRGIDPISVSFGIDYGHLLLARIGTRRGTSAHDRSHITAVGPTANIAFQLQDFAGPDEIVVGDLVYDYTRKNKDHLRMVLPPNWAWTVGTPPREYYAWEYTGRKKGPV